MALFGEIASETSRAAVRSTGSSTGVSSAGVSSAGVSSVVNSAVALFYIVPGSSSRKKVRVRVRVSNMLSKVPLRSNHSGAFPNSMRPLSMPATMSEQPWDYAFKGTSSLESLPSFFPNSIWQLSMPGTISEQHWDFVLDGSSSLESLPSFFFPNSIRQLSMPGTMSEQPWDYALEGISSLESLPSFFSELDPAALDAWDLCPNNTGHMLSKVLLRSNHS